MSRYKVLSAMFLAGGLMWGATPASAQDWWHPARWMMPPAYGYGSGYRSSCPGGVCPPRRPAYGTGYCPSGNCYRAGCGPAGCGRPDYGLSPYGNYRVPTYAPGAVPDYRPRSVPIPESYPGSMSRGYRPAPVPDFDDDDGDPRAWGSSYRGRREYHPFYE